MHAPTTSEPHAHRTREPWHDANARGLALANDGEWTSAAEVWRDAVEAVAADNDAESADALALLLSNLAQACFRTGCIDDSIRHAQRACALRAALVGDDAVAVSRARADLAVLLAAADRADEGLNVIARALAGIELSAGDEDLRLASVLENAARIAIAAGQPSTAEPYLIRLHALLAAYEAPTDAADILLVRLAAYRRATNSFHDVDCVVDAPIDESSNALPAHDVLGFRVEYGTPIEQESGSPDYAREKPPAITHIATPVAGTPVQSAPMPTLNITPDDALRERRVIRRPRLRFS